MKQLFLLFSFFVTLNALAQQGNIVIPSGHAAGVEKLLLSPDGKYLYSANFQRIIMWDIKNQRQLYSFSLAVDMKTTESLSSFILSADGNYVAASGGFGIRCFSTVTGESIFTLDYLNYSATFSADSRKIYYTGEMQDPKSYKRLEGIIATDLKTLEQEPIFICEDVGNCNFKRFGVLKNQLVMLGYPTGWQIVDLDKKEIIYTSEVDTKTTLFGTVEEKRFFPILNTNLIAATERKKGEIYDRLLFYDAYSGQIFPSREVGSDYKVFSSRDGGSLIVEPGTYSDEVELIDVKKSGQALKVIERSNLKMGEGAALRTSIVDANSEQIFYETAGEIKGMDLKSFQNTANFSKGMADLPIVINTEYNEKYEELRILTDYINYVSIDLNRMAVKRNVRLDTPDQSAREVSFSTTGDTIAIEDYEQAFFLGIESGKKTPISQTLFGEPPFESQTRPNLIFGREGKYAYAIKNEYKDQGDAQTVFQITLATSTNRKIAAFQHNLEIDIQQDLIVGYDKTETSFIVKSWQLSTGKQIFSTIIPRTETEVKLMAAKVFDNQSKIAILKGYALEVYELATGKLLSSGMPSNRSNENKFILNHTATMVAETFGDGRLSLLDTAYTKKYLIQAHEGLIYNAYFSSNDQLIYTVGDDNTIKIFKTDSGELLGTLYLSSDPKDFVFIDPTGRFDGTPAAMEKIYYLKDRKVITLDKIYEKFYTPSLYQRLLNGEIFDPIDIIIKGTPKVKINYAEATRNLEVEEDVPTYQNNTGFADIVVNATSDDDEIDEIRLFHNGKIVTLTTRNLIVADNEGGSQTKKYELALLPGTNNIRAVALNSQRTESDPDEIFVNYSAESSNSSTETKPANVNTGVIADINKDATLHLIVVGINEYENKSMSLNYAIADATSFKEEVEKDAKTVLSEVKTYFVTNTTANKTGITDAFDQVRQNAKAQDVFIFYYAGHGVIGKDKEFYLVPTDVSDLNNVQAELEQKGIASKLLQQYAIDIRAQKQLFILDACQSAGAFEKLLANDGDQQKSIAVVSRSTGTHWMAASGAQQFANEFSSLGHGAFTYVLLEALKGEAANNNMITVNGLKNFLQVEVPLLMKKYNGSAQYPASYGFGNDFPVEVIRK